MKAFLLCAIQLFAAGSVFAGNKAILEKARTQFASADAQLNKTYHAVCATLDKGQVAKLQALQRDWLPYRDEKSESLLHFNGVETDAPKSSPEYWEYETGLTKTRTEFLRVYSGAAVRKGISGDYSDFFDGDLHLGETAKGIAFSLTVVRGHSAHTGEISGVATLHGDRAIYKETVPAGESRPACEMTFTFIDGHIVKIESKNAEYYQGAGAYFEGLYYKTSNRRAEGRRMG